MISDKDRNALILYRLNQAQESISEVEKLLQLDLLKVAVNRIYYGMFYCLNALALRYEFKSSKHLQLIGWFNQNFIKNGLFEVRYGKILRDAYNNRTEGDYLPFVEFERSDVLQMFGDMKDFILTLTTFLSENQQVEPIS